MWPDLMWVANHKVGKLSRVHAVCCIRICSQISYSYVFVYYLWNEVLALVKRSIKLVVLSHSVFLLYFGLQKDAQLPKFSFIMKN